MRCFGETPLGDSSAEQLANCHGDGNGNKAANNYTQYWTGWFGSTVFGA